MMLAYQPIRSLATLNMVFYQGAAAAQRIYMVLDKPIKIKNEPHLPSLQIKNCDIKFNDVSFKYEATNEKAINNMREKGLKFEYKRLEKIPNDIAQNIYKKSDIIICPLIGFDKKLNRLGRGGGYYDKILLKNQSAIKIGFAYSIQQSEAIPIEKHDISMNAIITEKFIYNKPEIKRKIL